MLDILLALNIFLFSKIFCATLWPVKQFNWNSPPPLVRTGNLIREKIWASRSFSIPESYSMCLTRRAFPHAPAKKEQEYEINMFQKKKWEIVCLAKRIRFSPHIFFFFLWREALSSVAFPPPPLFNRPSSSPPLLGWHNSRSSAWEISPHALSPLPCPKKEQKPYTHPVSFQLENIKKNDKNKRWYKKVYFNCCPKIIFQTVEYILFFGGVLLLREQFSRPVG